MAKVKFYADKEGITVNGTEISTDGTEIALENGKEYPVGGADYTKVKVYQSSVPALYTITEEGVPVDVGYHPEGGYHKDDYESENTEVEDENGEVISNSQYYAVADVDGSLLQKQGVLDKIKGRGNSSWEASAKEFGKYAFNITLGNKVDLVGNDGTRSKKYCLVSYNADEARMRNMIIYGLSQEIGLEFVADYMPVDLYNNNKYIGSYLLTDKVEIGDPLVHIVNLDDINEEWNANDGGDTSKITNAEIYEGKQLDAYGKKIKDKKVNLDDYRKGAYIKSGTYNEYEKDSSSVSNNSAPGFFKYVKLEEPDAKEYEKSGFLLEFELNERFADEISGFISNKGQQIVCKYPEYASKEEMLFIMGKWNEAEKDMYNENATYEDLSEHIDVESFAKMYLIQELSKNLDGVATSYYVFYHNGKLHAGCSWDFDWALGQYVQNSEPGKTVSEQISGKFKDKAGYTLDNPKGWWINSREIYPSTGTLNSTAALCQNENFWYVVQAEWNENFKPAIDAYSVDSSKTSTPADLNGSKIYENYTLVHGSTVMDESRWGFIAKDLILTWGSKDTGDTHDTATVWLNDFIYDRVKWMHDNGLKSTDYDIQPPVISVDKTEVQAGTVVTLTIKDVTDGIYYSYEVYNGTELVDTITDGEYTFTVDETATYTVKAVSSKSNNTSDASNAVTVTVTAPACEHANIEKTPAVDPDCENAGSTAGEKCIDCGEVLLAIEEVPALGHLDDVVLSGKPADCENTGLTDGKQCSRCNKITVAQEVIKALGHTEVVDKAVAPGCVTTGLTEGKHCSVCKEVLVKQDVVDALGHTEETEAGYAATCTKDGLTDRVVCSVCDAVISDHEVIPATGHSWNDMYCGICGEQRELGVLQNASITLEDNIGITFRFKPNLPLGPEDTVSAQCILPNGSIKTVPAKIRFVNEECFVDVTCNVAAKEMASDVKVKLMFEEFSTQTYKYSVQKYAETILGDERYAHTHELVKAMLNYGAAAQVQFKYNLNNLANSILSEEERVVDKADFTNYEYVLTDNDANVTYYGSKLTLETKTAVKHYFMVKEGTPEFKVDGKVVDYNYANGLYEIVISDIIAQNLDEPIVVTVGDLTLNYNAFSYGYLAAKTQPDNTALNAVMDAMFAYNQAADSYEP